MDYSLHIDKKFIEDLIEKLKDGQNIEINKIDLKSKWYNFQDNDEQNEFAKDVCAIANTVGLDGYLIIGISKKGETFNSPISSSGINDSAKIYQLLVKRTDNAPVIDISEIKIQENIISVVKIPPSLNKPHIVKNHKNRENAIFVRKGTNTPIANRSDIDLMYYDRKNIELEYNAIIEIFSRSNFIFNAENIDSSSRAWRLTVELFIQNVGRRPIAFKECKLRFESKKTSEINKNFTFTLKQYQFDGKKIDSRANILLSPLIVKSNEAMITSFDFDSIAVPIIYHQHLKGDFSEGGSFSAQVELVSVRNEMFKSNEFKYTID